MSKNKHDDDDDDDDDDEDELKRKLQVLEIGDSESESDSEELFEINLINIYVKEGLDTIKEEYCESTVFSIDILDKLDVVYVAVGVDGGSSMEALSWALKHAVTPSSTTVTLIHVFPQLNLIPTPLGRIPRSRVNPEHVNIHLAQEKRKRKLLLHKFIHLCLHSKVKVEIMLIEGDNIAEAILDLVRNLKIRKLVIGTTPSNLRKAGTRRQNCIAEMVLKNAQEMCDIKIICEGTEVIDQMINNDYTSPRSSNMSSSSSSSSSNSNSISRVSPHDVVVDESHNGTVVPVPVPVPVPLKHLTSNSLWLSIRSRFLSPRKRKNHLDQLELVLPVPSHYV